MASHVLHTESLYTVRDWAVTADIWKKDKINSNLLDYY